MKVKLRYSVWYDKKFYSAGDVIEITQKEWESFKNISDIVEKEQVVEVETQEEKIKLKKK